MGVIVTAALELGRKALRWHGPLMLFAAAMAVLTVVAAVGLAVDDRVIAGAPAWAKPLKFSISFVVYAVTWAWMLTFQRRARRWGWWAGTAIAVAGVVEMIAIVGQVVRGTRSHFNVETSFDNMVFQLMGVTISVLLVGHFVLAAILLAGRYGDRATASAVRLGMVISAVGLGLGGLMLSPTAEQIAAGERDDVVRTTIGAHSVGVPDGGQGILFVNWSTEGGDLRIPHFIGMHALQILPLVAMVLAVAAARSPRLHVAVRVQLVRIAAAGYSGLVALVTWQALRGQPLIRPDGWTLAAFAALVAVVVVATALALRGSPPNPDNSTAGTGIAASETPIKEGIPR
ncbi:hypothetical protein SAMN05216266_108253 [Amycolatopsis marina]|uniref:Uncharacterized protein n=1 Tax=Amycolatopsis marina TaxID=490629 RepID=A0A1I1ABK8_9PSEU|nr:hypothetical protein [Amycolatopsis marina]SFB33870.1 hypothetical protein SAMN05216266_108253 [Amycolatopsis marina]